jgi:ribosomal protein L11 methyltransferase
MNYIQIAFAEPIAAEVKDHLVYELGEIGFDSFDEDETCFNAYISEADFNAEKLKNVLVNFDLPGGYQQKKHEAQNWNATWEQSYEAIAIDDKLRIRAAFHEPDNRFEHEIIIVPKMSFGTGHHDTTRLICTAMRDENWKDKEVLDMGCGTGVLAIYAIKLGAKNCWAIDIEQNSFENTIENCALNEITAIHVEKGGIEKVPNTLFNVILANINRNVLLEQIPEYSKHLSPNGRLYLSGFFESDVPVLKEACEKWGMKFVSTKTSNGWAMLLMEKNS